MIKAIILALATSAVLEHLQGGFAFADVTGAGATTNTQSTTGSSATNTAITGGYHSEATTNYQSGSSSSTTTNNSTTNNNNSYTGDTRTVPSASAPGISAMSQDLCTVALAWNTKPLIGGSIGITKRDMNCERMKLSKLLFDFNMKVAAVSILCQDSRVFSAMAHAGTPCPFNGKIGDEALDEWNKYDQQRPDYEEYTKTLRYMEKVDATNSGGTR